MEFHLKSFSAELIYIEDDHMPEVSRVYAAATIQRADGHGLKALFSAMPKDIRRSLTNAYDAELRCRWTSDFQSVLAELEGVFMASRYPFEYGADITR